jgi:hypothetical protein
MFSVRPSVLVLSLAVALVLPLLARAADDAPEAPGATATTEQAAPEPIAVIGIGPGMGMGPMHAEHCRMNKASRMSDGTPCMMSPNTGCQMAGASAMTDKRLDMLEKRMDMMQMMMEMMMRQSAGGSQ